MPGGIPIGTPNNPRDPTIVNLPGGTPAAEGLLDKLTEGATPNTPPKYPGTGFIPPGGGFIGYRPTSKSGPPAIDINIPGVPIQKLHFP
jgi:hypothetical protein